MRQFIIKLVAINPEAYSLGLAYLHAALKKNPLLQARISVSQHIYEWEEVDAPYYDLTILVAHLLDGDLDIIGFSTFVWNVDLVVYLSCILKNLRSQLNIVVGGAEIRRETPEILNKFPDGTFFIFGEGEEALCELVKCLFDDKLNCLPSDVGRKVREKIIYGPRSNKYLDPAHLPSPILEGTLDISHLSSWLPAYSTSRGCVYQCPFCLWHDNKGLRYFPLERVFAELKQLASLNLERIWFVDTLFGRDEERDSQILYFLAEWPVRTSFAFETHWRFLTPRLVRAFAQVNLAWIAVGIQSLNPETLRDCRHNRDVERIFKSVRLLYCALPDPRKIHLDLIFGLPGDNPEAVIQSIDDIKEEFPLITIFFEVLKILPGTSFYYQARQENWQIHDSRSFYDVISRKDFPLDFLLKLKNLGLGIDFLQHPLCRSWSEEILQRFNIHFTKMATVAGRVLKQRGLDSHLEYQREFWFERLFAKETDLLDSLKKEVENRLGVNV